MIHFFFFLCLFLVCTRGNKFISLTKDNVVVIKDAIDDQGVSQAIYKLNKMKNKSDVFIYLDTPGGSVESGNRLLMEIQKYNLSCIADRAYSMGFVLLQGCKTRYIRPYGRIMQHQISYGVKGEKGKIDSYQQFIHQLEDDLVTIQANRVKLTPQEFRYKTMNEWWMIGRHALENDCVDSIADVFCDDTLTRQNYTVKYGPIELIYSQCPLVNDPIDTKIRYS
jgi:ATP-dependent protease ClpP protease subunit